MIVLPLNSSLIFLMASPFLLSLIIFFIFIRQLSLLINLFKTETRSKKPFSVMLIAVSNPGINVQSLNNNKFKFYIKIISKLLILCISFDKFLLKYPHFPILINSFDFKIDFTTISNNILISLLKF